MPFFSKPVPGSLDDGGIPRRISTPAGQRLSVIMENSNHLPPPYAPYANGRTSLGSRPSAQGSSPTLPPQAFLKTGRGKNKMFSAPFTAWRNSHSDQGYERAQDAGPYSPTDSPLAEKIGSSVRSKRDALSSKVGGLRRLLLVLLVMLMLAIGLGVGLGIGLRKDHDNGSGNMMPDSSGDGNDTPDTSDNATAAFPAGKWDMEVYLDTVNTNCTSNPATWTCYPYKTFYDDPTAIVTLNWLIEKEDGDAYFVESADNPFGVQVPRTKLALLSANTADERMSFQFSTPKEVHPNVALNGDDSASVCRYASTTFQASLYTRMPRDKGLSGGPSQRSGTTDYVPWPYAIKIEQLAAAGDGVPQCFELENGKPTSKLIEIKAAPEGQLCDCLYRNWKTPQSN